MSNFRRLVATVVLALGAAPLAAQDVTERATAPTAERSALTPVVAATPSAVAQPEPSTESSGGRVETGVQAQASQAGLPDAPPAPVRGRNPAMMIVGGAALIVGAVIGGTPGMLVMLGGAAVGLFGLWNYLQ